MRTVISSIIFAASILSAYSQIPPKNRIVGKIYEAGHLNHITALKNFKEMEAITSGSTKKGYAFSKIYDGKQTIILYTQYIAPGSYKILAELNLGVVDPDTKLAMASCRVNLKNDEKIIAIVKPAPTNTFFKNILKAWRVDVKKHNFVKISNTGIDCADLNDGAY